MFHLLSSCVIYEIQKNDFPLGVVPLLRGTSVSLNVHPPGMYVCTVKLLNHMMCIQ